MTCVILSGPHWGAPLSWDVKPLTASVSRCRGAATSWLPGTRLGIMKAVTTCHTLSDALECAFGQALIDGADAAMVVGGAEIYRLALPRADKVVLTRVHGAVDGDVVFDLGLLAQWRETAQTVTTRQMATAMPFTIVELEPPDDPI